MDKSTILKRINEFASHDLGSAANALLNELGYSSDRTLNIDDKTYQGFADNFVGDQDFNKSKAMTSDWVYADFLFQLADDSITMQQSIFDYENVFDKGRYESYLFFAIELKDKPYSRSQLSGITREINKLFLMPAMIIFKIGGTLTFSIINRRLNRRNENRDVLEKVTLIKDIDIVDTHRAHIEILYDLSYAEIKRLNTINTFNDLHKAWQSILDTKALNKKFYTELSNWYFWAMEEVNFPDSLYGPMGKSLAKTDPKVRENVAKSLIRFLTRILFVWFIKEKKLVSDKFFAEKYIKGIIKGFDTESANSNYYKAILQNLFFATLNQEVDKRAFRTDGNNYGVTTLLRYKNMFSDSDEFLRLTATVPFLNGGLFECLDYFDESQKTSHGGDQRYYIDGFTDRNDIEVDFPTYLLFGKERTVDLSVELGTKAKSSSVKGLINILKSYKFTIAENTPIEQDIALDPELLGNVFENLLASYNPETKSTARKSTGSYYTPKEIVNYMVDESLKQYLFKALKDNCDWSDEDIECGLDILFTYTERDHLFDEKQVVILIDAINKCKILDPACGSGAFPMGALHKLVYVLHKLDPNNERWMKRQLANVQDVEDSKLREKMEQDITQAFEKNELDFGRKLYLIENCIYGVDIQPIATQISKLRFFISLMVDQNVDWSNRTDNFGIRALPNLETKFVAANSLIDLPKQELQYDMFVNTEENDKLQKTLVDIRHRLFSAKTPATKRKYRELERRTRESLKANLQSSGMEKQSAELIAEWDPYDQNASSPFFSSEWMFGITTGFDIVIGNPPYISTKNVTPSDKRAFETMYGFSDDTYNLFSFRGIMLLNNGGTLNYIIPKTFWTTQTKSNMRELFLNNSIQYIFDTANPFESVMVDTCVIQVAKKRYSDKHTVRFLDGSENFEQPQKYSVLQKVYRNTQNSVIFIPTDYNMNIYRLYGEKVKALYDTWWEKIKTSKDIEKNRYILTKYREQLKPGDIALLGCLTDGGQGLATANNGKYIAVRTSSKWAKNIIESRPIKLSAAIKDYSIPLSFLHPYSSVDDLFAKGNENQIIRVFDKLKEEYGRDIFGQGYIYRLVHDDEIADVDNLSKEEKENGIDTHKNYYVPYDKGDKDGNRWYLETPFAIAWSKENVRYLKTNSGKKGEGMPVVRNPQFYFKEGFCWNNILNPNARLLKVKLKQATVNDVGSMSLISLETRLPNSFFVSLLNSNIAFDYYREFINCTVNIQINDLRQVPIVIPSHDMISEIQQLFNRIVDLKKHALLSETDEQLLICYEGEMDALISKLYSVNT